MALNCLITKYNKQIKKSRARCRILRCIILWGIVGSILWAVILSIFALLHLRIPELLRACLTIIFGPTLMVNYQTIPTFIQSLLTIVFTCIIVFNIAQFVHSERTLEHYKSNLDPLSNDNPHLSRVAKGILDTSQDLFNKMIVPGLEATEEPKLHVWKYILGSGTSPRVIAGRETFNLIIPFGFLAMFRKNEEGARSIIAHEIAHLKHEDHNLLIETTIYSYLIAFVLLPLHIYSIAYASCTYFALNRDLSRMHTDALYNMSQMLLEGDIYRAIDTIETLLFFTGIQLVFFATLRNIRFASEYNADMAACVYADPYALKDVFVEIVQSEAKQSYTTRMINTFKRVFSHHPSPKSRWRKVESYIRILNTNSELERV